MTALARHRALSIESPDAGRLAGAALFALAAQFMTVIMLAASIAPGYDYGNGAISDLGVTPATAGLFNASLVAAGVLNILGGWLYHRSVGRLRILLTFMIAGIGAVGAGLFPLDHGAIHSLFALFAFVFFNLEAIAVGSITHGWIRAVSVVAGTVGLAFVVLMVIGDSGTTTAFGAIGHGGTERMIVYPAMLWMLVLAGELLAGRTDGRPDAERAEPGH